MWVKLFILGCICALPTTQAETKIRIVHTNDIHGRFDQTSQGSGKCSAKEAKNNKCYGGIPRILTATNAEKERAKKDNVPILVLNAGDTFQGTIWTSFYKWPIVTDFIKILEIDAMGVGNHEFDEGLENLTLFLKSISTIPVLACNIDTSSEPLMKGHTIKPSMTIDRGGLKIGIVGFSTVESALATQTAGKVIFHDEIPCVTEEIKKMKDSGIKYIIGLSHSGYEKDKVIAAAVPDLDVIVGGHSHTFLYTGKQPDSERIVGNYPTIVTSSSGKQVAIVQAYAFSKYLGFIEVSFDDNGDVLEAVGSPIVLNSKFAENTTGLELIKKWSAGIESIGKQKLGTSRVFLNGTCRFNECNMGNLITDAFVDYGVRQLVNRSWSGVAIGIIQGGGIRAPIDPPDGIITRQDVITTMPFFTPLLVFAIQGKHLLEALEWSVERYDTTLTTGRGEFLQFSGIHVIYDLTQSVGSRVVRATARCAKCKYPTYYPIDLEEWYPIVATDFMADGGDNYTMFQKNKIIIKKYDTTDTDIVAEYIMAKALIYNGVEERIIFSSSSTYCIKPVVLIVCAIYNTCY